MVRQYKIHTNLDGTDDKIWDVTNGKVRFYQPSNLGLQSTNNIWQSNGVGVMGTRSITQPQIEFKLETFGESLSENYQLMKDFVNDIISKKFVTLEYQTEIFQVYADLTLADVTKTEGYGKNGTFSEKITFDIITKWYTYENLTFEKIQNGKVIDGKSKIYGGYKGSETALQNYNRLKASPSLNLPNLNLMTNTKITQGYIDSKIWAPIGNTELAVGSNNGIKVINNGGAVGSIGGFSYIKPINVNVGDTITLSCYIKNTGTVDIKNFSISIAFYGKSRSYPTKDNLVIPNDGKPYFFSLTTIVPSGSDVAIPRWFDVATAVNEKHIFEVDEIKLESGSIATPWMPSANEVTINDISEYFGYNYIANQAYTYYGETNIERLRRWDIKDEIFSFMGILYPQLPKTPTGVRFLDDIGNEYTAIVFKTEQAQDYILINTDVNDEIYQGWNGTTSLNLFPVMDFERYRTRIIEHGQMELINLSKAEFKIKRKADFI